MKIDLTKKTPCRRCLQYGNMYNMEVVRTPDKLVVERRDLDHARWVTYYVKKTFLGLIDYWSFYGWAHAEESTEKTVKFINEQLS